MRRLMILMLFVTGNVAANEYIHGTVNLKSGESHTGILRWDDDEETFWSDHFNGKKSEIPQFSSLSDDVKEQIEDAQLGPKVDVLSFRITLSSVFAEDLESPDFIVPFAAIAQLTTKSNDTGGKGLNVLLHNGDSFDSFQGSNDLDAEIYLKKPNGQTKQFTLNQIKSIVFSQAEIGFEGFNQGIYAVVESELGQFKGRVFWDRDERYLNETIEGTEVSKPESEELSISLSDIKSIEKKDKSSLITKHNGQQLLLNGTNDVDEDNRGLYIDTPERGRILLPWAQFNKMTIQDKPQNDWQTYHRALLEKGKLSGQVTLKNGDQVTAADMVFNMSQSSMAEMVRCKVKGMDYYMPLFLIKSIEPQSGQHAVVNLKSGEQLTMYGASSFTEENLGLLYSKNGQPHYIQWKDVAKIEFDH